MKHYAEDLTTVTGDLVIPVRNTLHIFQSASLNSAFSLVNVHLF